MAILFALVVVGLGHGTVLMESFPCNEPQFIVNLVYAVGLGAVISLVVFAGPGMVYRRKLDQWREKCRQMAASPAWENRQPRLCETIVSGRKTRATS
jgi:hypothetical protein